MATIVKRNKRNRVTVDYVGDVPENKAHPAQYTITHVATGRYYVGSTGNMEQRRWDQMKTLNAGRHSNPNFRDLYKPGDELVFTVNPVDSREDAYRAEQELLDIKRDDPMLLNICEDVRGYAPGHRHTPEVIEKLASRRGEDHHMHGVKFTPEHRQRIGDAHRGKVLSAETRAKVSASKIGQNAGGDSTLAAPISIDGVIYPTVDSAAEAVGIAPCTLRRRIDRNDPRFPGWKRVNPKRGT